MAPPGPGVHAAGRICGALEARGAGAARLPEGHGQREGGGGGIGQGRQQGAAGGGSATGGIVGRMGARWTEQERRGGATLPLLRPFPFLSAPLSSPLSGLPLVPFAPALHARTWPRRRWQSPFGWGVVVPMASPPVGRGRRLWLEEGGTGVRAGAAAGGGGGG